MMRNFPAKLAHRLRVAGHDALHTFDLPAGNRTTDAEINELSVRNLRVVITKDTDFLDSFLLFHRPHELLLVSAGNVTNVSLEALFVPQIPAFESYDYLELTRTTL